MTLIPGSSIQLAGRPSPPIHFPTGEEHCIRLHSLDHSLYSGLLVQKLPFRPIGKIMIYFIGSAVAIRCTIPSGAGEQSRVSFSIDDGPARIISQETSSSSQWRHVFWDSGTLEIGPHLLVITNLVDSVSLHLDSIDYEPETLL
jgi:hypothetical protein